MGILIKSINPIIKLMTISFCLSITIGVAELLFQIPTQEIQIAQGIFCLLVLFALFAYVGLSTNILHPKLIQLSTEAKKVLKDVYSFIIYLMGLTSLGIGMELLLMSVNYPATNPITALGAGYGILAFILVLIK